MVGLIHLILGHLHTGGAVGSDRRHIKDDGLIGDGACQIGEVFLIAALGIDEQQVFHQEGGLAPGDGIPGRQPHPVGERQLIGLGQIAAGPHHSHIAVPIAQDAHQNGDGLRIGDGPVRIEIAVGVSPDDARSGGGVLPGAAGGALGGHGDITPGPVGGRDVLEDGAVHLGRHTVAVAHELHRHLAEFRPGEGALRRKGGAAGAVDDTQEPQGLSGPRHLGVGDVGKGGGNCGRGVRRCGQDQHTAQDGAGEQQRQNSFCSHIFSLLAVWSCTLIPPAGPPRAEGRWP